MVAGKGMSEERSVAVRRLLAFAVDWLVLVVWGGLAFGVVMIATGGHPPRMANPWTMQGISFAVMTVPFTLYFALCESSPLRASVGKRLLGLLVSREDGGRPSFGTALLRNAVKFTPWELGHLVACQAAFSNAEGFPTWVWVPAAIAFAGPLWWLIEIFRAGRTPYDRLTLTRVGRLPDSGNHFG